MLDDECRTFSMWRKGCSGVTLIEIPNLKSAPIIKQHLARSCRRKQPCSTPRLPPVSQPANCCNQRKSQVAMRQQKGSGVVATHIAFVHHCSVRSQLDRDAAERR